MKTAEAGVDEGTSARDATFLSFFQDLLRDDPTLTIVDVGAQDVSYEGHIYSSLTRLWPHHIIGFEPVYTEEVVQKTESGVRRVLPFAVGDGSEQVLNVTKYTPLSSFYRPNRSLRAECHGPSHHYDVVSTVSMQTRALDALPLDQADFIKIDAQGAEPLIVKGGSRVVSETPLVYCETFFVPFYEDVPLFDEHLSLFRAHGFELFDLYLNGRRRADVRTPDAYPALGPQGGGGRLIWGDALYGQRYLSSADPSAEHRPKALKAALLLHFLFHKYDVVARILELYAGEARGRDYVGIVKAF